MVVLSKFPGPGPARSTYRSKLLDIDSRTAVDGGLEISGQELLSGGQVGAVIEVLDDGGALRLWLCKTVVRKGMQARISRVRGLESPHFILDDS